FADDGDKFEDENRIEEDRTSAIESQEIENIFRWDINKFVYIWRLSGGSSVQQFGYRGDVFSRLIIVESFEFNSSIDFWKYGVFMQASKNLFQERLLVSACIRSDINSFTNEGKNPLKTLSPRLSLAYHLTPQWDINASVGTYFKIPTYTALGFRNAGGTFVNRYMD